MNGVFQVYAVGVLATAALYTYVSYYDKEMGRREALDTQPTWAVLGAVAFFSVFSWLAFVPMALAVLANLGVKDQQ